LIFKLDSTKQEAALETARRKIAEVDAALGAAQAVALKKTTGKTAKRKTVKA
jgi:multidrug resistance efflux pump